MPKRHRLKPRVRTSSQSSVEIQVTDNDTTITTTTTLTTGPVSSSSLSSAHSALVRVQPDLLKILRLVGASGLPSKYGELFTVKQVGHYLKDYIKTKELWDVYNPHVANCAGDPLERVFGVKSFTPADANLLLLKNVQALEPDHHQTSTAKSKICDQKSNTNKEAPSAAGSAPDVPGSIEEEASPIQEAERKDAEPSISGTGPATSTSPSSTSSQLKHSGGGKEDAGSTPKKTKKKKGKKRKWTKLEKHTSSDSIESRTHDQSAPPPRKHRSSISIVYSDSDAGAGNHPWVVRIQDIMEVQDSDQTDKLSIQSKETALVQSSDDDMWFLEEEISVEYQSTYSDPPPFDVEYEVQSEADDEDAEAQACDDASGRDDEDENRSESSEEEILVLCNDSDMEFWADSESGGPDSDESSTDEELTEDDKWVCDYCSTRNRPLRRYCDRCCRLRPGWLPERRSRRARNALSIRHPSHPAGGRTPSTETDDDHDIRQANVVADLPVSTASVVSLQDPVSSTSGIFLRNADEPVITRESNSSSVSASSTFEAVIANDGSAITASNVNKSTHSGEVGIACSQRNSLSGSPRSDADTIPICDLQYQNLDSSNERDTILPTDVNESVNSQLSLGDESRSVQSSFNSSLYYPPDNQLPKYQVVESAQKMQDNSLDESDMTTVQMLHTDSGICLAHTSSQDSGCADLTPGSSFLNDSLTPSGHSMNQSSILSPDDGSLSRDKMPLSILVDSGSGRLPPVRTCLSNFQVCSTATHVSPACSSITAATTTALPIGISSQMSITSPRSAVKQLTDTSVIPVSQKNNATADTNTEANNLCLICMNGPKEASLIHGDTGHQMSCYPCAMSLYRRSKACPICRQPIQNVIRNYFV